MKICITFFDCYARQDRVMIVDFSEVKKYRNPEYYSDLKCFSLYEISGY